MRRIEKKLATGLLFGSRISVVIWQFLAVWPWLATSVCISTVADWADASGVDTNVPYQVTCNGFTTTRWTSR